MFGLNELGLIFNYFFFFHTLLHQSNRHYYRKQILGNKQINFQQQMRKMITEKQFKALEKSQSFLPLRQIYNELKPLSSPSKLSLNRNFQQSQRHQTTPAEKLNISSSNNRSITKKIFENGQTSYPDAKSFNFSGETVVQIKKLLTLMGSKKNIMSHISQSLGLVCPNKLQFGKDVGQIVGNSFVEYITLAQKINSQLKKGVNLMEFNNNECLNHQNDQLKKQNAYLIEHCHKLEEESLKYRRMYQHQNNMKNNQQQKNISKIIFAGFANVFQKIKLFESQIRNKFRCFDQKLISISSWRNRITNSRCWREQTHKYRSINNQLHKLLQQKMEALQKITTKEDNYLQQIQIELEHQKQSVQQKNDKIRNLQHQLQNSHTSLQSHKKLYDKVLEINIELKRQICLQKAKRESHSPSLDIIEFTQGQTSYFKDKIIEDWSQE